MGLKIEVQESSLRHEEAKDSGVTRKIRGNQVEHGVLILEAKKKKCFQEHEGTKSLRESIY